MTRPRHAEHRRGPRVAALVIALVVLIAGAALALRFWPRSDTAATVTTGDVTAGGDTSSTAPADDASSEAASASASKEAAASAAAAAARATLKNCITRVRSTDEVLNQAAIGVHNWSMHVQAQTDADRGKISVEHMNHTFKKTKAEGPDDVERYVKAKKERQPVGDACDTRSGATAEVAKKLTSCQQRIAAQGPALKRAEVAMQDWNHHLADMRRSASGEVPGPRAQQIWLATWRKAPKHLVPYDAATNKVNSAPACT